MNENVVLTPERILEVTEDVLRRFGLAKATVVDVARALDVSHGSVYRHFPEQGVAAPGGRQSAGSTAPMRRWQKIAEATGPAPARLEKWLRTHVRHQAQESLSDDPEMFATYLTLAQEACEVVSAHKECLVDQVAQILADGVKQGAFEVADAKATVARGIRRHHPLPSSRPFRRMERSAACRADRRPAGAAAEGTGSAA